MELLKNAMSHIEIGGSIPQFLRKYKFRSLVNTISIQGKLVAPLQNS